MTHFRTYCIGEYDADELYEKFGEGTEVPEYSNGNVYEDDIIKFVEYYTTDRYEKDYLKRVTNKELVSKGNALIQRYRLPDEEKRKQTFKEIMEEVFEPLYAEYGDSWNSNRWRKDKNGVWTEYTTYNPHTVFDYFDEEEETTLGELVNPIETLCNSCGIFKDNHYTDFEKVGWWGYSADTDKRKHDTEIVAQLLEGLSPDTPIYRFDCHI
ncbi:MAG: hypothetical protein J6X18_02745 [Bacteroidales bacterium]|nr:hypothetical protein [Bacteroidales bacterium]